MGNSLKNISIMLPKVTLMNEIFLTKKEIGEILIRKRAERSLRRKRNLTIIRWSAAAIFALFLTTTLVLNSDKIYETGADKMIVALSEGSEITVMENSKVSYNKLKWIFSREVSLTGSASFVVSKGDKFTVKTSMGDISVLGTQFFVAQSDGGLHVDCFEGSVKVVTTGGEQVLQKGESVKFDSHEMITFSNEPLPEYLIYDNTSLIEILTRIEEIYSITIPNKQSYGSIYFTGAFSTQNLNEALEVVLTSCDLNYGLSNDIVNIQ